LQIYVKLEVYASESLKVKRNFDIKIPPYSHRSIEIMTGSYSEVKRMILMTEKPIEKFCMTNLKSDFF